MAGNESWQGIWLKIERAREHVRDLETRMIAFLRLKPYKAVLSQETATGQHVISARVEEQPPIWWGSFITSSSRGVGASLQYVPSLVLFPWLAGHVPAQPAAPPGDYCSCWTSSIASSPNHEL